MCATLASAWESVLLQLRAWFRVCQCTESFEARVRAGLTDAGVVLESDPAEPIGIVCFEQVDEALVALLHEARNDPRRRILALAASPEAAGAGRVWRLLHAGADDVLVWNERACAQLAARLQRWFEVDELAAQAAAQESLVGESPAWRALIRKIVEAARFSTMPRPLPSACPVGELMNLPTVLATPEITSPRKLSSSSSLLTSISPAARFSFSSSFKIDPPAGGGPYPPSPCASPTCVRSIS